MTRREALKALGTGAALITLGAVPRSRGAEVLVPGGVGATKQPFVLPPLPYEAGALEPHIDTLTMQIHYAKHHAAYIKNANKALEGHPALAGMTAEEILVNLPSIDEPLRATLRNNVGGHVNHSFFWPLLSPQGGGEPVGDLAAALGRDFGSYAAFKAQFSEAAAKRFGSGWAWLGLKGGKLFVRSTANQDSLLADNAAPVVGLDVWEHAYYLKHQNVRADYIDAFWHVLNWNQAGRNYATALAAGQA